MTRTPIDANLREAIFAHDTVCLYCGTGDKPTLDHVIPYRVLNNRTLVNNPDDPMFLVRACGSCNQKKADHFIQNSTTKKIVLPLRFFMDLAWVQSLIDHQWVEENSKITAYHLMHLINLLNNSQDGNSQTQDWKPAQTIANMMRILPITLTPSIQAFTDWIMDRTPKDRIPHGINIIEWYLRTSTRDFSLLGTSLMNTVQQPATILARLVDLKPPRPGLDLETNRHIIQTAFTWNPGIAHAVREQYGISFQVLQALKKSEGAFDKKLIHWLDKVYPFWRLPLKHGPLTIVEEEAETYLLHQQENTELYLFSPQFTQWWRRIAAKEYHQYIRFMQSYFPHAQSLVTLRETHRR